jgi:hypothetical protein
MLLGQKKLLQIICRSLNKATCMLDIRHCCGSFNRDSMYERQFNLWTNCWLSGWILRGGGICPSSWREICTNRADNRECSGQLSSYYDSACILHFQHKQPLHCGEWWKYHSVIITGCRQRQSNNLIIENTFNRGWKSWRLSYRQFRIS